MTSAVDEVVAVVEALHPIIEEPRHGCCAPPKLCKGHAPECGGKSHGMNRPAWPCADLRAVREVRDRLTAESS